MPDCLIVSTLFQGFNCFCQCLLQLRLFLVFLCKAEVIKNHIACVQRLTGSILAVLTNCLQRDTFLPCVGEPSCGQGWELKLIYQLRTYSLMTISKWMSKKEFNSQQKTHFKNHFLILNKKNRILQKSFSKCNLKKREISELIKKKKSKIYF